MYIRCDNLEKFPVHKKKMLQLKAYGYNELSPYMYVFIRMVGGMEYGLLIIVMDREKHIISMIYGGSMLKG